MSREGNAVIEARCLEENWPRNLSAFSSSSSRDAPPDTLFFFFFLLEPFPRRKWPPSSPRKKKNDERSQGIQRNDLSISAWSPFTLPLPWISYLLSLSFTEVDVAILPPLFPPRKLEILMYVYERFLLFFFLSKILKFLPRGIEIFISKENRKFCFPFFDTSFHWNNKDVSTMYLSSLTGFGIKFHVCLN